MEPSSRPGTFGSGSATGRPGVVIVPLDGSAGAQAAVPLATYLSSAFGAPLHRVSVTLPSGTAPGPGREAHADALSLLHGTPPVSRPPVAQTTWTASGGPPPPPPPATNVVGVVSGDGDVEVVLEGTSVATALGDYAARHPDALICMATHARGGLHRRLVGNVVEELLEQARSPVVAVGPRVEVEATAQRPETILLAAGADLPRSTVPLLASWARLLGAQVVVARVSAPAGSGSGPAGDGWDERAVADRLVSRFAQHRTPAMAKRLHGDSVPLALLELAEQIGGPLLLAAPVGPSTAPPVSGITHELLRRSRWPVVASVGGTS
ncbi:MAG: universal stress protein [Actinomycetota bacterium]